MGTYAFWGLSATVLLAWLSVVIKLKWWTEAIGRWLFILSGELVFLCSFIYALQIDLVPEFFRVQYRLIIYGTLGLVVLWLIVDIWRKNWHHWAWSREED
jgi:hypothetical protein